LTISNYLDKQSFFLSMFEVPNRAFFVKDDLRYSLAVYFWLSMGVFFFILFFQPFETAGQDFNSRLVFIAGLTVITYFAMTLFYIIFPWIFPQLLYSENHQSRLYVIVNAILWLFSSTAYIFFIRYIGHSDLSIVLAVRAVILCFVPILIMAIIRENENLRHQEVNLRENIINLKLKLQEQVENGEELIQFISDNKSENVRVHPGDVLLLNSAENYVEVVFMKDNVRQQKLIRTTLKNVEEQLRKYPEFIRCHRTNIINTKYILKLVSNYQGHRLVIHDYDKEVPVSRQYLLRVREILDMV